MEPTCIMKANQSISAKCGDCQFLCKKFSGGLTNTVSFLGAETEVLPERLVQPTRPKNGTQNFHHATPFIKEIIVVLRLNFHIVTTLTYWKLGWQLNKLPSNSNSQCHHILALRTMKTLKNQRSRRKLAVWKNCSINQKRCSLEAKETLKKFQYNKGIDIVKHRCTITNLCNLCLHR